MSNRRFHKMGPGTGRGSAAFPRRAPASPAAIRALYTALTSTRAGQRRATIIERGNEEKTQLKPFDRLQAIAMGRDLNRNNPAAITILEQRKVLTVGHVKAQFNTPDDEWNKVASEFFNTDWASDCFHDEPAYLADIAQLIELARMREGDILVAFDDFLLNSGKVMVFEADQLVSVAPGDWDNPAVNAKWRYEVTDEQGNPVLDGEGKPVSKPYFQDSGVITDQYRRVVGYIVNSLNLADEMRGAITLPYSDVLIIPIECARLVKHRFRIGQRRGVPSLLPVAGNLADIDEMIRSELSTARMRSKIMAFVTRNADSVSAEQAATLEALFSKLDQAAPGTTEREAAAAEVVQELKKYPKLEEGTGGFTEYLEEGDKVEMPAIDRPNLDTTSFHDHLADSAGASQGLARGYSRMAVASSYTAHRGETCMTHRHIRNHQKQHEHGYLDWLAIKVTEWAVGKGILAPGPAGWKRKISWDMPEPDAIDAEKEAKADAVNQKNGKISLRDLLGPAWREKLEETAECLAYAKELGIPLSMFETVAGAPVEEKNIDDTDDDKEEIPA